MQVPWPILSATDNVAVANFSSNFDSNSRFFSGSTTVSYQAIDTSGNKAYCSFLVVISDVTPPLMWCPSNFTVNMSLDHSFANVTWPLPNASDNSGTVFLSQPTLKPGIYFGGIYSVHYQATDASNNSVSCTFFFSVVDSQPPSFVSMPENIVVFTSPHVNYTRNVTWFNPTARDNVNVASLLCDHDPGSSFNFGTTTIVCVAVDTAGNSATAAFTVTVLDNEPPTIANCPASIVTPTDPSLSTAQVSWLTPLATDNVLVASFNVLGVSSSSNTRTSAVFLYGTTVVVYTATDSSGNRAQCSFNVTVFDDEPPHIVCPGGMGLNALYYALPSGASSATVDFPSATATDNVMVSSLSSVPSKGTLFTLGSSSTITFTATDTSGNVAQCTFEIVLQQTTEILAGLPSYQVVGGSQLKNFLFYNTTHTSDSQMLLRFVVYSNPVQAFVSLLHTNPSNTNAAWMLPSASAPTSFNESITTRGDIMLFSAPYVLPLYDWTPRLLVTVQPADSLTEAVYYVTALEQRLLAFTNIAPTSLFSSALSGAGSPDVSVTSSVQSTLMVDTVLIEKIRYFRVDLIPGMGELLLQFAVIAPSAAKSLKICSSYLKIDPVCDSRNEDISLQLISTNSSAVPFFIFPAIPLNSSLSAYYHKSSGYLADSDSVLLVSSPGAAQTASTMLKNSIFIAVYGDISADVGSTSLDFALRASYGACPSGSSGSPCNSPFGYCQISNLTGETARVSSYAPFTPVAGSCICSTGYSGSACELSHAAANSTVSTSCLLCTSNTKLVLWAAIFFPIFVLLLLLFICCFYVCKKKDGTLADALGCYARCGDTRCNGVFCRDRSCWGKPCSEQPCCSHSCADILCWDCCLCCCLPGKLFCCARPKVTPGSPTSPTQPGSLQLILFSFYYAGIDINIGIILKNFLIANSLIVWINYMIFYSKLFLRSLFVNFNLFVHLS